MKAILYAFLAAVFYAINIPTLVRHHTHPHQHTFTHFHGGYVHTSTAATSTPIRSRILTDTAISERTAHTPTGILPPYLNENLAKHNEALMLEHVRLGNATRS